MTHQQAKHHRTSVLALGFNLALSGILAFGGVLQKDAQAVAAGDEIVVIPKEQVDSMVYQALWDQSFQGNEAIEVLIYDMFILEGAKAGMSTTDLTHAIGELRDKVNDKLHPHAVSIARGQAPSDDPPPGSGDNAAARVVVDASLSVSPLKLFSGKIWQTLRQVADEQLSKSATEEMTNRRAILRLRGLIEYRVLPLLFAEAKTNPAVSGPCDAIQQKKIKVSVKNFDGAKTIKETPTLVIPPEIVQGIQLNGTINVTLNELKALTQNEFDLIHLSLADIQDTLNTIDAKQNIVIDYINNQQERERMQALAEAKAAEHKLKLEAIQSSIFIISSLTSFIDPKLGKQIDAIATSALQIGNALDGWLAAVAGLSTLDKIGSLSTVVMTGNVLGAVMNVVSLFSDSGPSPDQIILQEIGKLREQVKQLRTEMHGRFDRLDQELNVIYGTMQDRFDKIDIQLGKINANILDIQRDLLDLDNRLSRIERNNFELLGALGRRPLVEAVNEGLGYQQRTGHVMPFQPDFQHYEALFKTWGTEHAFDELATGPSQRDFSDGALFKELNALPMDANLNYLNTWLKLHGLPAISNSRMASPRDWLFAARAYSQLALEWPEYMKQIDPQDQASLDAVGADLEAATLKLSTLGNGSGSKGNSLLYSQVVTYYQNKLDLLNNSIITVENSFVHDVQNDPNVQRTQPFDLYGGLDQSLTFQAPESLNMTCGNPRGLSFVAPKNIAALVPNFNRYTLAEYFGKFGTLTLCISSDYVDEQEICNGRPPECNTFGHFHVTIDVRFNNVSVENLSVTGAQLEKEGDPPTLLRQRWTGSANWKAKFESEATPNAPTPDLAAQRAQVLAKTTTDLHNQLATYQHIADARVLSELSVGSLHPAAVELAGGKALLDSLITLGLQRAVNNDDFLHGMLYGNQQLVDDNQIIGTFALSGTQTVTGTQITSNPRQLLKQTADLRTVGFTKLMNHYLDAITAQTHVETDEIIADARGDLNLAVRIARLQLSATPSPSLTPTPMPTPAPTATPSERKMYVPVVQK